MQEILSLRDPEDRDRLIYILESSLDVHKPSQFFAWTQGPLQSLLPHEILICGMAEAPGRELALSRPRFSGHQFGVKPCYRKGAGKAEEGRRCSCAAEVKYWLAGRKKEVVLRLLRGEPVDVLSREVSVPIFKLEQCSDRALTGIDLGLTERGNDPVEKQLDEANRRIGERVWRSRSAIGAAGEAPFGRVEIIVSYGRGCASCVTSGFPVRACFA